MAAAADSLVKKGALSRRQSEEFLRAVQAEGAEFKKATGNQVLESAKKVLGELGVVTAGDVAKLHKEIKELKAMLKPACHAKELTA
jgi:polyhydroxyalkanoate synthesis regulator phasin